MSIISDIINELAQDRDWVEDKVTEQAYNIEMHLIKIYLWRDTEYKNHWISELNGFLNHVKRLKKNHKYPSSKDLYTWLWEEDTKDKFKEDLRHEIMRVGDEGEYKNLSVPSNVNYNNAEKFVSSYIRWISNELSNRGRVYKDEIEDEIEILLKKY